jgi:DNA-binding MarR family transcriptional regulator
MRKAKPLPAPCIEQVDTSYLETLVGYNARRAALAIIGHFLQRMEVHGFKPVMFSVASLPSNNPGITSRQLCSTLGILPPNLVIMVNALEKRERIIRLPHPSDGRAMGLHPTPLGLKVMQEAEETASQLEDDVTGRLTPAERKTLMRLLQKVYR